MLKDRDYDVTPYIIAHIYPQIRDGSAKMRGWFGAKGGPWAKFFYVKGSHRPRPLTRLRRSLIDKTPPITLIRTRRMCIDELVCIMAVGDHWRSFLLLSVKPQGRNKMCIGLNVYPIL